MHFLKSLKRSFRKEVKKKKTMIKLIKTLNHLKSLGNTVIVVEHDEEAIRSADHIIDIGPGAGKHGGEICASGTLKDILNNEKSITAQYLSGQKEIAIPKKRLKPGTDFISIVKASENNLQDVTANIPVGLFTCITGVSGSGKSSLINQTLLPISSFVLNKAKLAKEINCEKIDGLDHISTPSKPISSQYFASDAKASIVSLISSELIA